MHKLLSLVPFITVLSAQPPQSGCDLAGALERHRTGDFAGAAARYQACVALDPNRSEVRSNLGAVLVRLGRFQEAIEQYVAALTTAPAQIAPQLRFNLALAYYKSAQLTEAAE